MNKELFFKMFKNQKYVEQLKQIPQNYSVKHDDEEKTTEITIYGIIGNTWFSDSFSANDIDRALNEAGDNDIVINLNSPGGDAFDGISIFNRLKRHNGKITIHVDGWACSAASIIAMAADNLIMELGSMMMIHEASSIVIGSKKDMRKEADILEELEEGIIDIYNTKAKISREEIREKIDEETWMSAKASVEFGFADDATGVEFDGEPEEEPQNKEPQDRKSVLNELQNILEPNEEPQQPAAKKQRGFFY